jgi:hypothetical protein
MSITSAKTGATGISLALENNFMEPIASTLVGAGGVNTVIFNDIPQTYKHLQIRINGRSNRNDTWDDLGIRLNSDNGINYVWHNLSGDGSSASASATTGSSLPRIGRLGSDTTVTSSFGVDVIDILDYTNTNKYTTMRGLSGVDNNGTGTINFRSALWMNMDAVTTIGFFAVVGSTITQYSRFSLYGIKG